jgi:hypothetical protein
MPMGAPGWPLLAFCTASMLSARMALARSRRLGIANLLLGLLRKIEGNEKRPVFSPSRGLGGNDRSADACCKARAEVVRLIKNRPSTNIKTF